MPFKLRVSLVRRSRLGRGFGAARDGASVGGRSEVTFLRRRWGIWLIRLVVVGIRIIVARLYD
jgi:hypothetical protein